MKVLSPFTNPSKPFTKETEGIAHGQDIQRPSFFEFSLCCRISRTPLSETD